MTHAHLLLVRLRGIVKKMGGSVVLDGCGGYDVIAPEGKRWKAAEATCQPIPMGEAESNKEKAEMVQTALNMVKEGTEKIRA